MLTAIGRAAVARRALACAAPSALVARAVARPPLRTLVASAWARAPASASAAKKTATKPKKKAASTTKAKAKKPAAKKPAAKKKAAPKKKKKPVKKAVKKAPLRKKKRTLTPEEAERRELRTLRQMAILKAPKRLPENSWTVYLANNSPKDGQALPSWIHKLKESYTGLSTSEKERLAATAKANSKANREKQQQWVESLPYEAIYLANIARRRLARRLNKSRTFTIHDDRQPKRASGPCSLYMRSRREAGLGGDGSDQQNFFRTVAAEWNGLSEAEKKPFYDRAAADARRSAEEFKEVRIAAKAYWKAQMEPVTPPRA